MSTQNSTHFEKVTKTPSLRWKSVWDSWSSSSVLGVWCCIVIQFLVMKGIYDEGFFVCFIFLEEEKGDSGVYLFVILTKTLSYLLATTTIWNKTERKSMHWCHSHLQKPFVKFVNNFLLLCLRWAEQVPVISCCCGFQPGFYGLSEYQYGCYACDCDIGGALRTGCDQTSGQCECRPNIIGKQCKQVESGFCFAHLDHNLYEAEYSKGSGVRSVCVTVCVGQGMTV